MGTRVGTPMKTIVPPSRVLLVDRDESLGRAAAEILRASGYEVTLAVTAAEAQEQLQREIPCLVLIGALAPAETRALVRMLSADPRRTPAIIVSSEGGLPASGRATEASADASAMGSHIAALVREPVELVRLVERYCSPDKTFAAPVRGQRIN